MDLGRLPYWANFAFGGNMILRGYHSTKLCQGVQLILFRWAGKLSYQGCSARGSLRQCCMLGCWEIVGASYTRWGGASWSRAWSCHSEQLEKKTEGKTPKVLASWTLKGKKRNSKDKTYPQSSCEQNLSTLGRQVRKNAQQGGRWVSKGLCQDIPRCWESMQWCRWNMICNNSVFNCWV